MTRLLVHNGDISDWASAIIALLGFAAILSKAGGLF